MNNFFGLPTHPLLVHLPVVMVLLAAGSGEELEHKVERSQTLEHHARLGETARLKSVILFVG
ncbi:MAG: hypothetical protein ACKOCE_04345 [Acidimicrobiia bacterium]